METIEQINDDFNVKKPKKKGLIVGGIIAIVLIIALVLVYFLVLAKPQFIFNSAIDKIFKVNSEKYDSIKLESKIAASIEAEDSSMQEQLAEIEKYTLTFGTQMDYDKKQEIIDLGLEYDNEAVADARVCYNSKDLYVYFEGLFDKYIKLGIDKEQKETMESVFDNATSDEQLKDIEKAIKIIRDELKAQIKEYGEFESEKVTINVGDKEEKVTKSTLTLSNKQVCNIISNICSNLMENDKFLECFEKSPKDTLKEINNQIKTIKADGKNYVKISIYTKGTFNKAVGIDISLYYADEKQTIKISLIKEDMNLYAYNISVITRSAKIDAIKGKLENKIEKNEKNEQSGKTIITIDVAETGKAKLEIDYFVEYNNGVDQIDTSNSVNIYELTEEDGVAIIEKLMERPVIGDLINNIMNVGEDENQDFIIDDM